MLPFRSPRLLRALLFALPLFAAAPVPLHAETCPYLWMCVGNPALGNSFPNSQALGDNSVAVYGLARTNGSIAIGGTAGYNGAADTDPTGPTFNTNATAVGTGSKALGGQSSAFGAGAQATGAGDVAVGAGAFANTSNVGNSNATAVGAGALANNSLATAIGAQSNATGSGAFAGGAGSSASGTKAVALLGQASGDFALSFGVGSVASGAYASAFGVGSSATADQATAIGFNSVANEPNTVSIGDAANQRRLTNVAEGQANTDAVNVQQLNDAIGQVSTGGVTWIASTETQAAHAKGNSGLAMGSNAQAGNSGTAFNVAVGPNAEAGASADTSQNLAVGASAAAGLHGSSMLGTGGQATAVGSSAVADAVASSAFGQSAQVLAGAAFSTAIGSGTVADRPFTTAFGNRQLVQVLAGSEPTDAVNVAQIAGVVGGFGGGASFAGGTFQPPSYLLSGQTFRDVGTALTFLDQRIDAVPPGGGGSVGPQGPKGDTGDTGPQGPAGQDGTGNGNDAKAVHYDNATQKDVTLQGADGTQIHNLANGVVPNDGANVAQVQAAVQQSRTYTDNQVAAAKDWAKGYTDQQFNRASRQSAQAGAVGSAIGMLALGAQGIQQSDRLVMSVAGYRGQSAVGIGFNHVSQSGRVSVAIGGAFASGGTAIGVSVGIGLGQ